MKPRRQAVWTALMAILIIAATVRLPVAAEDGADAFVEWPDPAYREAETVAEDSRTGSLTYTASEDGKTVTISYDLGGENRSYTVPSRADYLFGGYAGVDDTGHAL